MKQIFSQTQKEIFHTLWPLFAISGFFIIFGIYKSMTKMKTPLFRYDATVYQEKFIAEESQILNSSSYQILSKFHKYGSGHASVTFKINLEEVSSVDDVIQKHMNKGFKQVNGERVTLCRGFESLFFAKASDEPNFYMYWHYPDDECNE